jgi:drug/metabolite transporter (DMT)-like permease
MCGVTPTGRRGPVSQRSGWLGGFAVTIVFALLSAMSSAATLLTQRVSSGAGPRGSIWRVAKYLVRQRLWLLGTAAAVAAFVLQAAALRHGQLSQVQPLLVTELVFVLVLRRLWLRQRVRQAAWASAAFTCVSLAGFLVAAEPRGGHPVPAGSAWAESLALFGGGAAAMTLGASKGSPVRRAALYGTASAVAGALSATFLKTAVTTLTTHGLPAMLSDWPVYAMAVAALASGLLVRAALHTGPLSVSQPLMVIVNPVVSIWLSVWLFGEYFTDDAAVIAFGACSFVALSAGAVAMTRTSPRLDAPVVPTSNDGPRP